MQHHAPREAYLLDNFGDAEGELYVKNDNQSVSLNSRGGLVYELNAATTRQEMDHDTITATQAAAGMTYNAEHLLDNRALVIEWDDHSYQYVSRVPLGETLTVAPTDVLSFRIMAMPEDPANDLAGNSGLDQDLVIALGDGDPEVRIGQLLNALKRNVRYMSAIGLHAEGMTVEESQAMFEEKAFMDFGNASQQAYRGTYDPGYLNYTLGKLMINKLREDWTVGRGGREAWGRFHDQFLSYGTPPIPLVRQMMLGPDYGGDTALLPK